VVTHEPDYFGKKGFTSRQSLMRKEKTINIAQLSELPLEADVAQVDLTSMGYTKLLGTGKITKPLTITVAACSKTAAEKVEKAGGKILTASEEHGE
jgi:large subunit ribosomal protein L15